MALLRPNGTIKTYVPLATPQDHAQRLAPTVQAMLPNGFDKIEAFALSIGPGSFTGLRIGAAFLKGLGVVYPRPTFAISSLEVLAATAMASAKSKTSCMAVIDARRGNVFAALFGPDLVPDPTFPEGLYPAALIKERFGAREDVLWAGDGVPVVGVTERVVDQAAWTPRADQLGLRAVVAQQTRVGVDPIEIAPVYHQLSAAEESIGIRAV